MGVEWLVMSTTQDIVAKLWNLCHVLRDDGITYHQYVTELTYLLFLKMMKETAQEGQLPTGYRWDDLLAKGGVDEALRHAVPGEEIKPDLLAGPAQLSRQPHIGARRAGEIGAEIEDRDRLVGGAHAPRLARRCAPRNGQPSVGRKSAAHSANANGGLRVAHPPYGLLMLIVIASEATQSR